MTTRCVSVRCIGNNVSLYGRALINGSCDIIVELNCLQVLVILAVISIREHLFNFKCKM